MIVPLVKAGVFDGKNVAVILYNAHEASIAARISTDIANCRLGNVVAALAKFKISFKPGNEFAKLLRLLCILFDDMKNIPQRSFFSDPREAGKSLDRLFNYF